MTQLNRRHFLQGAAGALGAIGLSQLGLERHATRYGKALAQSTPRKIALLIGINDYPLRDRLLGSVNDIELQKQLLIHRFNFHPDDVHTLTNEQATRQGILDAFDEYLLKQVREGDIVVFHFSGHGSQVQEFERMQRLLSGLNIDCIAENCHNNTIVPFDYSNSGSNVVQDIMGHTLFLMRSALQTENVTFLLDCCYSGGGKRGNVIMRSRNQEYAQSNLKGTSIIGPKTPRIAPEEWAYQERLLARLDWSPKEFINRLQSGGNGFFVASSNRNQQSADYTFDGFHAGVFTYLLTQYLWQENVTRPLDQTILSVARNTTRLSRYSQIPEFNHLDIPSEQQNSIFHDLPRSIPAEAVVLENLDNNRVKIWLGGLEPLSLLAFNNGAVFTMIDSSGAEIGQIQQDSSREGLTTTGKILNKVPANASLGNLQGSLLQERIRQIPDSLKMLVGLDDTLTNAEQLIATQELQRYEYIGLRPIQSGEQIHILLGRMTESVCQRLQRAGVPNLPPVNSLGLFTATQEPISDSVFGKPGESIECVINDCLAPQLKGLSLKRLLNLMVNQNSAQLNVSVSVDQAQSASVLATRGDPEVPILIPALSARGIDEIPVEDQMNVKITNNEPQSLHIGLLVIDAVGDLSLLYPPISDDPDIDVVKSERSISVELRAAEPHGLADLLVIASRQSITGFLRTLRQAITEQRRSETTINPDQVMPNEVMQDVFEALMINRNSEEEIDSEPRTIGLDVNQVAVLSVLYDIIPDTNS
ncbi:MAG: caspase family protein [Cyanobacteria bacterium P01_F01_bin.150]